MMSMAVETAERGESSDTHSGSRMAKSVESHGEAPVLLYQPFIDLAQRAAVSADAIPFDIAFNTGPTTREYECFQALDASHRRTGVKADVFWGMVSSKFELKAAMPLVAFKAAALAAQLAGLDAWAFNPMIGNAAIYENVWQQGHLSGHAGLDVVAHHLAGLGLPVGHPEDASTFFLCNYVCGNARFWSGYFAFCEAVLHLLDAEVIKQSPVGKVYGGAAHYGRDVTAGMRPFVIERLLGLYLAKARTDGLRIGTFTPGAADFERKFGSRLGAVLHGLYVRKCAAIAQGDSSLFMAWHEARLPLLQQPALAIYADDPPTWLLDTPLG